MGKIAVIIVTYNGMKWLSQCMCDLFKSTIPIRVYAIDNGSKDGTVEFIERCYPDVVLHKATENLGFGKANNIGIKKALEDGAEYLFLLNQDGYVSPDTIANLVHFVERDPRYGVVSPIQLNGRGTDLDKNFAILMNNRNCPNFINDSYFRKLKEHYDVTFVMAAFWLVTKQTIMKVGLFNPVFPHYGEDNDYLNRVLYHGFRIGIVTTSIGKHDREHRQVSVEKQIYQRYINHLIFINDLNKNFVVEFCRSCASFLKNLILRTSGFSLLKYEVGCFWSIILSNAYMSFNYRKINKRAGN